MSNQDQVDVDISGVSIHVKGKKGEEVNVSPAGIYVKDGDSVVNIGFSGIKIQDGTTHLKFSVWKPLVACGVSLLIFVALLTAVIVGVVKLMMR